MVNVVIVCTICMLECFSIKSESLHRKVVLLEIRKFALENESMYKMVKSRSVERKMDKCVKQIVEYSSILQGSVK